MLSMSEQSTTTLKLKSTAQILPLLLFIKASWTHGRRDFHSAMQFSPCFLSHRYYIVHQGKIALLLYNSRNLPLMPAVNVIRDKYYLDFGSSG